MINNNITFKKILSSLNLQPSLNSNKFNTASNTLILKETDNLDINNLSTESAKLNLRLKDLLGKEDISILEFNKRISNYPHAKINPELFPIQSIGYNFDSKKNNLQLKKRVIKMLENIFLYFQVLISKPKFIEMPDRIIIKIFYFMKNNDFKYKINNQEALLNIFMENEHLILPSYFKGWTYNNVKTFRREEITTKYMAKKALIDVLVNKNDKKLPLHTELLRKADEIIQSNEALRNLSEPILERDRLFLNEWAIKRLNKVLKILNRLFYKTGKKVELQLIRLYSPGHDAAILSKVVSISTFRYNFRILLKKMWKKVAIYNSTKLASTKYNIVNNITPLSQLIENEENNKKALLNSPSPLEAGIVTEVNNNLSANTEPLFFKVLNSNSSDITINTTPLLNEIEISTDSNIKTNLISNVSNGQKEVRNIISKVLKSETLSSLFYDNIKDHKDLITNPISPGKVSGIKIRLAGRILTERLVPKKTVKVVQLGTLEKKSVKVVDTAYFTNKNKRGAFNIKVWISYTNN